MMCLLPSLMTVSLVAGGFGQGWFVSSLEEGMTASKVQAEIEAGFVEDLAPLLAAAFEEALLPRVAWSGLVSNQQVGRILREGVVGLAGDSHVLLWLQVVEAVGVGMLVTGGCLALVTAAGMLELPPLVAAALSPEWSVFVELMLAAPAAEAGMMLAGGHHSSERSVELWSALVLHTVACCEDCTAVDRWVADFSWQPRHQLVVPLLWLSSMKLMVVALALLAVASAAASPVLLAAGPAAARLVPLAAVLSAVLTLVAAGVVDVAVAVALPAGPPSVVAVATAVEPVDVAPAAEVVAVPAAAVAAGAATDVAVRVHVSMLLAVRLAVAWFGQVSFVSGLREETTASKVQAATVAGQTEPLESVAVLAHASVEAAQPGLVRSAQQLQQVGRTPTEGLLVVAGESFVDLLPLVDVAESGMMLRGCTAPALAGMLGLGGCFACAVALVTPALEQLTHHAVGLALVPGRSVSVGAVLTVEAELMTVGYCTAWVERSVMTPGLGRDCCAHLLLWLRHAAAAAGMMMAALMMAGLSAAGVTAFVRSISVA
mmetsp:Transcript_3586/g.9007  ORF Transcript_3586/g.9007 Transcript_3586/m.9007 type:complete len:544 (+) Transcript_3586:1874-3505(+)